MSKPFIVLGDKTDHGGVVLTASAQTDIAGIPVSRVGDKVMCPRCKGVFPIAAGDATLIIDGQAVARHGDKTACGATLISSQAQVHVSAGGGGGGGGGGGSAPAKSSSTPSGGNAASSGGAAAVASAVGAALAAAPAQVAGALNSAVESGAESATARMAEAERARGGSARGGWKVADVLKELCPQDKAVVDQLAKTDVVVVDRVYFDDQHYDGKKWQTKRFEAGGTSSGGVITVLSGESRDTAVTTLYHEIVHEVQPDTMSWTEKEVDAYLKTEQWTIGRGLPGQQGNDLRQRTSTGDWSADKAAIEKFVRAKYPVPQGPSGPIPTAIDDVGNVVLSDGSSRAPKLGDSIPGPQVTEGERTIPKSAWKCPGP